MARRSFSDSTLAASCENLVNYAFEDPHMRKRFANHGGMAISRNLGGDVSLGVLGNESGAYRTGELVARGAFL